MRLIKIFKRNEKGSITLMVLAAMIFVLVVITASYFAISNKSGNQDKKISKIAQQYRASDEDMDQEYQKVVSNLKVEDYVKVGDYVDYNPTIATKDGQNVDANKLTYTSQTGTATEHGNGYTSTEEGGGQTFTANSNVRWRVLNVEGDTVELISEEPIKTDLGKNFGFRGAIAYLYIEQELNEVCKIYGYGYGADTTKGGTYTVGGPLDTPTTKKIEGTGARSITIEDINKKAGIYEDAADEKMKYSDGTVIDSSYGSMTNPTSEVYYPTANGDYTTGKSTSVGVKDLKYTYYRYNKSKIENAEIQNMLFNENYWLASRCISTGSDYASFNASVVYDGYYASASALCIGKSSDLFENTSSGCAVRPVVTLKSDTIDLSIKYEKDNIWRLK